MIATEKIERIIELSLISGYVKDDDAPLSIMLISYPETAKSSMILKFNCPHTIESTDLSARPIVDFVVPKLRNNELHHLIISDLTKVLAHRDTTVNSTISFLNALMEEGVKQNLFFGQLFEFQTRKKCGIITALTFDYYYKMFRKFHEIGFTSRFIPISFEYSGQTVLNIHNAIKNNLMFNEIVKMKKIKKKKIHIPSEIADWISIKAQDIANKESQEKIRIRVKGKQKQISIKIYGFRLHRQLRKMAKSIALSHKRDIVSWSHLAELKELMDYIRLPKNPKVI